MKGLKRQQNSNAAEELPAPIPGGLKVLGRLEPDEYWEWRTTIEEMMHAKTRVDLAASHVRIKELETALLRREQSEKARQINVCKDEYDKLKRNLEKKHKLSLAETVISPENFEIRRLKHKDE